MNHHPFGLVLQTLESHADRIRREDEARRQHQREWIAKQNAAVEAGQPAFDAHVEKMLIEARNSPRRKAYLRALAPLDDLDADYNRGGQYPEGKW